MGIAMKIVSLILALGALVSGLTASWRWYQASQVQINPGWVGIDDYGPLEPVLPEQQQMGWTVATLSAFSEAAGLNKAASLWTACSVGLTAVSAIIGALAPN